MPGYLIGMLMACAMLTLPVGAELLGLDYTEAKLLGYAYAFEQASGLRKLPKSTPALPNEPSRTVMD